MSDDDARIIEASNFAVPDLTGPHYTFILKQLHETVRPQTYLEIGTQHGASLALARCASIAVDPEFHFHEPEILRQITSLPSLMLFRMTSDEFFSRRKPEQLFGKKVDFAFLDGFHQSEFVLRDFIHIERSSAPESIIAVHDCLPVDVIMTERVRSTQPRSSAHRARWWTGDVWRTALLLKRVRPDLSITVLDAAPTGLMFVTNLDPDSSLLSDHVAEYQRQMQSWSLEQMGIPKLFQELEAIPCSSFSPAERFTAREQIRSVRD
jgi:hypothetical protein